ncbi:uncharacterized protein LOC124194636 [Daphnia pulex]|uniref:uncharacterized protein LOC124194636 n=1 Tax=Daphnia pulex TaxID=6669 RepID=UPI001EDD7A87|nr:uncharacterized protein LOC124194636 [Daphnia pulex]
MNSLILCSIVLSAFFISTGDAIKCYVCNSATNKTGCSDTHTLNPNFLRDCNELSGGAKQHTVCRKIDQDAPDIAGIESNVRVIRECGQDDVATNACTQKTGMGGRQFICTCDHDGCNAGANVKMVLSTLFSFAVVALLGPKFLL